MATLAIYLLNIEKDASDLEVFLTLSIREIYGKQNKMEYKLAICLITFNQEKYISQALESVLIQKAGFHYQIFIGEDCSTDTTLSICLEYQNKYPDIVKVLHNEKNIGVVANTINTLAYIRKSGAKYIAMLEGDDYWIDPYKLQKQFDFLESNPEYGVIRTGGYNYIQKKNKLIIDNQLNILSGNIFTVAKKYTIIRTCSVCFRENLLDKIDFNGFISKKLSIADFPMFAIFSKYTKFGYLADLCVVYRVLEGSVSHEKIAINELNMTKDLLILKDI